jgi:hypothetical protein
VAASREGEGSAPDSVCITLTYTEKGTDNIIWIIQENHITTQLPSQPSSIYFDIGGVRVLEEEIEVDHPTSPSELQYDYELLQGIVYAWNRDGISFDVLIFGYDRTECRKIVESMIK